MAFRLYRLEKGVRSQIILTAHMVSSYMEEREKDRKRQKAKRDSSKNCTVMKPWEM